MRVSVRASATIARRAFFADARAFAEVEFRSERPSCAASLPKGQIMNTAACIALLTKVDAPTLGLHSLSPPPCREVDALVPYISAAVSAARWPPTEPLKKKPDPRRLRRRL